MTLLLLSVLISLSVSFICSLCEATLLSLTPSQTAELTQRHPKAGAIWQRLKTDIQRPIAVILILNTTTHTIGASIAGAQVSHIWGDQWLGAFAVVFTLVMLQVTEILPKTLGVRHNKAVAVASAKPLEVAIRVLAPVIKLLHYLNRPFEGKSAKGQTSSTMEEITALAGMARVARHIGPHEERIIKGATALSRTTAADVMIEMDHVAMISDGMKIKDALSAAQIDAHTRFPIYRNGTRDDVIGYVNFKEMIFTASSQGEDADIRKIVRPVHFVGPESSASDLLKSFIEQHEHMAIVRDADGKCLGLITMEDLVEELVGDLQDEFDRLPRHVHALSGDLWMFGGGVQMSDIKARLGINGTLPATGTLAAYIQKQLPDPPRPSNVVQSGGLELTVRRTRRGRVFEATAKVMQ